MSEEEYRQYIFDVFYNSGGFDIRKYRCCVSRRAPYGELMDAIEADPEHHYFLDFSTTIQLVYYNYRPWERLPVGCFRNVTYLGGVLMRYPSVEELWRSQGIDPERPYAAIAEGKVYVVDQRNYETKLQYIREHYAADAEMECVTVKSGFPIWRFSRNAEGISESPE